MILEQEFIKIKIIKKYKIMTYICTPTYENYDVQSYDHLQNQDLSRYAHLLKL